MLQEISKITGIKIDQDDLPTMQKLYAIVKQLPMEGFEVSIENSHFIRLVMKAKAKVERASEEQIKLYLGEVSAPAEERRITIKKSLKGSRVAYAGKAGVRYSYGPVWNLAVILAADGEKSIAMDPTKRHKLEHQAFVLGLMSVEDAEKMELRALNRAVAQAFGGDTRDQAYATAA